MRSFRERCNSKNGHCLRRAGAVALATVLVAGLTACGETPAPSVNSGVAPTQAVGADASTSALPAESQAPALNPVAAGTHRIESGNPRPIALTVSSNEPMSPSASARALVAATTSPSADAATRAAKIVVIPGTPATPGAGVPVDPRSQR